MGAVNKTKLIVREQDHLLLRWLDEILKMYKANNKFSNDINQAKK
jgi:hypothetical protein